MLLFDYRGAGQDLSKVLQLNPEYEDALLKRGYCKLMYGDYKSSVVDASNVARSKSESYLCYVYRARAKASMGDQRGAIADLIRIG